MDFFRIGTHRGRDCMVDPQGNPFFSLGIVHAGAYPEGEGQVLFNSKYAANWTTLAAKIAVDFAHWGFNTAGYDSPLAMVPHLPSMVDSYPANISYWMGEPAYPDV